MYQQRMKLLRISVIALIMACLATLIAIFKHIVFLILIALLCISFSLICEGLLAQFEFKKQFSFRLIILGILLLIVTGALFIRFLKS